MTGNSGPIQARLPRLPSLIQSKLTKTGYTRGATTKEIFQNRVTRNNPVLIPWEFWDRCKTPGDRSGGYENGYIVLIEPSWFFTNAHATQRLAQEGLRLGHNALLLYRKRADWIEYFQARGGRLPDGKLQTPAMSRRAPLGGTYMARVHATVADDGAVVIAGYDTTKCRGAGIRVYEYASTATISRTRLQLEALFWLCSDSDEAATQGGMSKDGTALRKAAVLQQARRARLLDLSRLHKQRIVDDSACTVCPLCLLPVSGHDFMQRSAQAVGRETYDLTTTEVGLFHINELRVGRLQHKAYNLGWGHHFCNVVTRDTGIAGTVTWMREVLARQPHLP